MDLFRSARKAIAPVKHVVRRPYRRFVLRRALRQVVNSSAGTPLSPAAVKNLIYGWGNKNWSANQEFIPSLVQAAWQAEGPILECGSGLSTLLLGSVAQQTGQRVWSLEHDPDWAKKSQESLASHNIHSVKVCLSELRDCKSYFWYAAPKQQMPTDFVLVICDGPPGSTPGGRYGLLPEMRAHLKPGCVILLDDAERAGEQEVLNRWCQELGATFEKIGATKSLARLIFPG